MKAPKRNLHLKTQRIYDVVRSPVVTEKSTNDTAHSRYTFVAAMSATKADVKVAVEVLFKVKVLSVHTAVQKGKSKRFKGRIGQRSDVKKAIVRIASGQTIDVGAGL
jgi:large subunit ribosomal protein L23